MAAMEILFKQVVASLGLDPEEIKKTVRETAETVVSAKVQLNRIERKLDLLLAKEGIEYDAGTGSEIERSRGELAGNGRETGAGN